MYHHIALFTLKEHADGRSKDENLQQILSNIQRLKDNIVQIRSVTAGPHQQIEGGDFPASDLAIEVEFETEDEYLAYFNHPIHQEAAQFAAKVSVPGGVVAITYMDVLS